MYTAKTFYIIRHGETDLNRQGIIQGRGMNTDLNEKGAAQAAANAGISALGGLIGGGGGGRN